MSGSLIKQGHTQPSCYLKPPVVIYKKEKCVMWDYLQHNFLISYFMPCLLLHLEFLIKYSITTQKFFIYRGLFFTLVVGGHFLLYTSLKLVFNVGMILYLNRIFGSIKYGRMMCFPREFCPTKILDGE